MEYVIWWKKFRDCFTSDLLLNANMESELGNQLTHLNSTNVFEHKEYGSSKEQRHSYHPYFVGLIVYALSLEDFCFLENQH